MERIYLKALRSLEKQEARFIRKTQKGLLRHTQPPKHEVLAEKIPPKLQEAIEKAFIKGFDLVFDKAGPILEKTYPKERIQAQHEVGDFAVDRLGPRKHLKKMDRQANRSSRGHTLLATLEGAGLGLLGIGVPDIPILTSLLFRSIYEIGLSYGFGHESIQERFYVLWLLKGALAQGEAQTRADAQVEQIGAYIDWELDFDLDLEEQIQDTARFLSQVMLMGKYLQSLPLVGVYGGWQNHVIMKRVCLYAKLKYKKRYLKKKKPI